MKTWGSPMKILGSPMNRLGSPMKILRPQWKFGGQWWKDGVSDDISGVSDKKSGSLQWKIVWVFDHNLGVSNENLGTPIPTLNCIPDFQLSTRPWKLLLRNKSNIRAKISLFFHPKSVEVYKFPLLSLMHKSAINSIEKTTIINTQFSISIIFSRSLKTGTIVNRLLNICKYLKRGSLKIASKVDMHFIFRKHPKLNYYCAYLVICSIPNWPKIAESATNIEFICNQGIGIKGKEMALVWHEKASRTALQNSTLN